MQLTEEERREIRESAAKRRKMCDLFHGDFTLDYSPAIEVIVQNDNAETERFHLTLRGVSEEQVRAIAASLQALRPLVGTPTQALKPFLTVARVIKPDETSGSRQWVAYEDWAALAAAFPEE